MSYLGAKSGAGVFQTIINLMPPHETYIEPFFGSGAIYKKKAKAFRSILNDKDKDCFKNFTDTEAIIFNKCALELLKLLDFDSFGETVIYCDPPYLHSTRSGNNRYKHELSDQDHWALCDLLSSIPAKIILSGYNNKIYSKQLPTWKRIDFQAMTRGGVRTESVWLNFEPEKQHYPTFSGKDFTDRQRIKRKAQRWGAKFKTLPENEKQAILQEILKTL